MRHKDCEVFLKCDGRVLEEYATDIDGDRISCYVASEAEKVSGFAACGVVCGHDCDVRACIWARHSLYEVSTTRLPGLASIPR